MKTDLVRQTIRRAHQNERQTGHLDRLIACRLPDIHRSINLKGHNPQKVLKDFVFTYVDRAPDFMDAAVDIAYKVGLEKHVTPVMKIAEAFFLSPPEQIQKQEGFDALLNESYLAHRLVEEVNDHYILHIGKALIPFNTMTANLIAHQLIGETFANKLDAIVHHTMAHFMESSIFNTESVSKYRQALENPRLIMAWQQWPCFSRQCGIELKLKQSVSISHHSFSRLI